MLLPSPTLPHLSTQPSLTHRADILSSFLLVLSFIVLPRRLFLLSRDNLDIYNNINTQLHTHTRANLQYSHRVNPAQSLQLSLQSSPHRSRPHNHLRSQLHNRVCSHHSIPLNNRLGNRLFNPRLSRLVNPQCDLQASQAISPLGNLRASLLRNPRVNHLISLQIGLQVRCLLYVWRCDMILLLSCDNV